MKQVTAWKCDACAMTSIYKGSVKRHESKCWKRRENKDCRTCEYWHYETESAYSGHRDGEATYNHQEVIVWCDKDIPLETNGSKYECSISGCEKYKPKGGI